MSDQSYSYMLRRSKSFNCIDWSEWIFHVRHLWHQPKLAYLELGVYEGRSMIIMQQMIFSHPSCSLFGVDAWDARHVGPLCKDPQKVRDRAYYNIGREPNVTLINNNTQAVLQSGRFPQRYFDMVYIDADHRALAVYADAVLAWPLLKPGGFILFDDCAPDYKRNAKGHGPRQAVEQLLEDHPTQLRLVYSNYQALLQKAEGTPKP